MFYESSNKLGKGKLKKKSTARWHVICKEWIRLAKVGKSKVEIKYFIYLNVWLFWFIYCTLKNYKVKNIL